MKKILVIFMFVFLNIEPNYSQYCNDTSCEWLENSIITNLQQFPGCAVEILYEQAFNCNPTRCLVKIKKVTPLNSNCPSQSQLTIPEYLRLSIENVLSVPFLFSQISGCERPTPSEPTKTIEIWYKSPCWQWSGLNNPSGPPPSITLCSDEGCCKVTYLVHYINENTLQPVRLFQEVIGLCQPNYPNCINICE